MQLNEAQRHNLSLICDTFAPGDGAAIPPASALGVPALVEGLAGTNPRPEEAATLAKLLSAWDSPLVGLALGRGPRKFSALDQQAREQALVSLSDSRFAAKRAIFLALKNAATTAYYLSPGPSGSSPLWDAMGYPGPPGPLSAAPPSALSPVTPQRDTTLDCDVVVVGSGAGGGVAAAVLAARGLKVVVLERGLHVPEAEFDGSELNGLSNLYASGPGGTKEGQLSILEAQCLGGGTVVNFATSFRTPDHVRDEWASLGAKQFADQEFDASLDAVWNRLGVTTAESQASARDVILERGLNALGWHVGTLARNVSGCDPVNECGRCGYGCRIGAKQSTARTWLLDAQEQGATLLTGVEVSTVVRAGGRASGVEGQTAQGHRVVVNARAVVVAAGSLQSPALLARSGLSNPNIGRHLRLHPATAVWAEFDEQVRPWEGTLQSRYSDEHGNVDGSGYGVVYETAPANPALTVAFMAWRGAKSHLDRMMRLGSMSSVGVITRDQDSGSVEIDSNGRPVVSYRVSERDAARIQTGVTGAAQILEAAGAKEIFSGHQAGISWNRHGGRPLSEFTAACGVAGYGPGKCAMAALHLMGSVRMGGSPETSALNSDGVTWEDPNVVVVDASTFPTASGVNPMISIQAIAHMSATRLAARL